MKPNNRVFTFVSTGLFVFGILNITAVKPVLSTKPALCAKDSEIDLRSDVKATTFIVNSQCNSTIISINGIPVYECEKTVNTSFPITSESCNNGVNLTMVLGKLNNTNYTMTVNNTQSGFYFHFRLIINDAIPHPSEPTVVIVINILILFASVIALIFMERSRRRSINLKHEDNKNNESDKEMTHSVKCEASDSKLLSCPSGNNPEDDAEQNEAKAQASHYVNDDGLLYVTIGDIEKQTTRTSAGSVKSKRERVQYQEIDFTKTGQITITEI